MYCYDYCVDVCDTSTSGKALQNESFGIYVGYLFSPTTDRSSKFYSSSNSVCSGSSKLSNWNKSSVCILSGCNMAKYTWIFGKGYKYNKKCALYIFVYDNDHERYSPLKIMSRKDKCTTTE